MKRILLLLFLATAGVAACYEDSCSCVYPPPPEAVLIINGSVLSGTGAPVSAGMNVRLQIRDAATCSVVIHSVTHEKVTGAFVDTFPRAELPYSVCIVGVAQPEHNAASWLTVSKQIDSVNVASDRPTPVQLSLRYEHAVIEGEMQAQNGISATAANLSYQLTLPDTSVARSGFGRVGPFRADSGQDVTLTLRYSAPFASAQLSTSWRTQADTREYFSIWIARSDPSPTYMPPPSSTLRAAIVANGVATADSIFLLRWKFTNIWANVVF